MLIILPTFDIYLYHLTKNLDIQVWRKYSNYHILSIFLISRSYFVCSSFDLSHQGTNSQFYIPLTVTHHLILNDISQIIGHLLSHNILGSFELLLDVFSGILWYHTPLPLDLSMLISHYCVFFFISKKSSVVEDKELLVELFFLLGSSTNWNYLFDCWCW